MFRKIKSAKTTRRNLRSKAPRLTIQALEERRVLHVGTHSATLDISIQNLAPTDGLVLTPAWIAAHNGNFQTARAGAAASAFAGFEALAEDGTVTGLQTRFDAHAPAGVDAVLSAPGGFAGAPVIEPGETATGQLLVTSSDINRFFSYASMIVPSNDAFIANLNSRSIVLFDSHGDFMGPQVINIYGHDIYDAGTEVNGPNLGPAFTTGTSTAITENGRIGSHRGLNDFIGTAKASGANLGTAFNPMTPIARITITQNGVPAGPDNRGPEASGGGAPLTATGVNFVEFQAIYTDPAGVKVSTIGIDDITIVGRNESSLVVQSVTTDAAVGTNPTTVTATYRLRKADSSNFTAADNGAFRVIAKPRQVSDMNDNFLRRGELGSIRVELAQQVEIRVQNLAPTGGLTLTPFWFGLHDGRFDLGTLDQAASGFAGLESLAEDGDSAALRTRFASQSAGGVDAVLGQPLGFAGAPVIEPGESATTTLTVTNPGANRYLSFASMVAPSNDAFIANLNQLAYNILDRRGQLSRPLVIDVYGKDVWDAGTEVNNPTGGAAFSNGGGTSVTETGVITKSTGLNAFVGTALPTGTNLTRAFSNQTPIARITIGAPGQTAPADRKRPEVRLVSGPTVTTASSPATVVVEITDASGVNLSSIETGDLRILGPNASTLRVASVTTDATTGTTPTTVRATFTLAPATGTGFTTTNNGNYKLFMAKDAVSDTATNRSLGESLGSFSIAL